MDKINSNQVSHESVLRRIESADLYDVVIRSPIEPARLLSQQLSQRIYFKREDLQPVFSFKCRGAYYKMQALAQLNPKPTVIAASAGNHAQGVALAATHLDMTAIIVMPATTPAIKVDAVKRHGAEVILHGDSYDDAREHCAQLQAKHGYAFIHPYDDMDVIAGQGTIAKEIHESLGDDVAMVFVAVGGGGLLAGVLSYFKMINPKVKVIAVEAEDSACLKAAIAADERVILDRVGIFADGVAVKQVGELPFALVNGHVHDVVSVTTDEICAGIKAIYEENRSIQEPAGALGVAGMLKYLANHDLPKGQGIVVVNCGANMNFDRLQHIAERTEIGAQRELLASVQIPEQPGAFRRFCELIGHLTVTEFNYRYAPTTQAQIFVGIGLSSDGPSREALLAEFEANGYSAEDMSDNDVAKIHVRHMVGGRVAGGVANERLYRVQFPERPRALLDFLSHMDPNWNISLFHYRNHGAAYGRVLVGMQVPAEDDEAFQAFLDNTGYRYFNETDNVAYQRFLSDS